MSVVSVRARSFILALFIRDDGERFLLGDNGYDFIDSQLHFSANTIENDEVEKQGADGTMLAGQVRRASVQTFDGYVGDATTPKEEIEQMRRAFIAFFAKDHHFRVIYVDCNRNAWQRKGGYLVDAPEVKELWQIHPEYHVGLNFEDVNYYEYDENAEGQEILANIMKVPLSSAVEGGLVWDEDGAVSEDATVEYDGDTATASGKSISISDAVEAPLSDFKLKGETSQNGTPTPSAPVPVKVVTGENVVKICGKNLFNTYAVVKGRLDNGVIGYASNTTSLAANDNSITFTVDAAWRGCISEAIPVKSNTEYHMKATSSGAAIGASAADYYSEEGWISRQAIPGALLEYSFTTPANCKYVRISWQTSQVGTATISNPQLELGSSATAFEAFSGQSYEVNLGKNLLDVQATLSPDSNLSQAGINYTIGEDGTIATSGVSTSAYKNLRFDLTLEAGTYFFSGCPEGGSLDGYSFIVQVGSTLNGDYGSGATFTLSEKTTVRAYVVRLGGSTGVNMNGKVFKPMIVKGATPTSFAPYFTPIELCKLGDYQDSIYKSGGKWYARKETGKILSYAGETISTDYISTTGSLTTGATIYYALATPTDTEITNEALIAQLEAILPQGQTYAGTNNITTVVSAGNEPGELEITYYTTYEAKVVGGGYVWEEGGSGGPTVIVNESISAVSPVWTVYGPALNPQLENVTNSDVIEYVGTVADGQTLVIDMGEQTAKLDGLNVISNVTGDFISLESGANTLLYSAGNDAPESEIGWSEIVG